MAFLLVGAKPLSNPWWNIVFRNLRNKLQWNFNRNSYILIRENALGNFVWKMGAISSWTQCVKQRTGYFNNVLSWHMITGFISCPKSLCCFLPLVRIIEFAWVSWRLNSSPTRFFVQLYAQIENVAGLCALNQPVTRKVVLCFKVIIMQIWPICTRLGIF